MSDIQRPRYLKRAEAATYLCVSVPTLARWASRNTGPRYFRLGRNARYLESDLDAFAESRRSDRQHAGTAEKRQSERAGSAAEPSSK
jgi:excisionase family DNA binding protein